MKFQFTLPSANIKNTALSFILFLIVACFVSFNVLLVHVHTASISASQGKTTTLRAESTEGPHVTLHAPTTSSTSAKSSELDTTLATMETSDCNITSSGTSSGMAYHFEPTTNYRQSATLPQWMKDYFDWHREQTLAMNECNFRDYRFIILRCSVVERKCGGVADRLKSLPFFIAAAAKSKRIFLIRWERPTKLEEFLIPNEINWSVPDWMYGKVNSFVDSEHAYYIPSGKRIMSGIKKYKDVVILEGLLQDYYGGSSYYYRMDCELDKNKKFDEQFAKKNNDFAGWPDYELISRDLFFTVFEPSPPVAKLVQEKMKLAKLVPGEFSASQYRAFYAVENKKHTRDEHELLSKTRNALNCASKMQPGDPIFFASDSKVAVVSARKMAEDNNRQIITFDDEQEALHLDKRDQWKSGNVADFFPTFVDLLIMAEAKCMSLGVGGFGRFANILSSDPTCVIRHDNERVRKTVKCKWYNKGDSIEESNW